MKRKLDRLSSIYKWVKMIEFNGYKEWGEEKEKMEIDHKNGIKRNYTAAKKKNIENLSNGQKRKSDKNRAHTRKKTLTNTNAVLKKN